jgi:hypothetical protein
MAKNVHLSGRSLVLLAIVAREEEVRFSHIFSVPVSS